MPVDILPDCRAGRAGDRKGAIETPSGWLIPVHCANCGREWGLVPEKHLTFAFCLCEPCAEKHGDPAHFYKEPDAAFWERIANEHKERQANGLFVPTTPEELAKELEDPSSVFAKLAEEWKSHVRKVA